MNTKAVDMLTQEQIVNKHQFIPGAFFVVAGREAFCSNCHGAGIKPSAITVSLELCPYCKGRGKHQIK